MSTISIGRMSAEEFWEWIHRPENRDRRFELDRGEVIEMPPPGERHGILCGWIAYLLWGYAIQYGGAVSSNDTGLLVERAPDAIRGPDVMLFGESAPLGDLNPKFSERIPKLVVEVLSPSDRPNKVSRRVSQYLRRGVPLVWLADPETHTVAVYRLGEIHQVLDEDEELTGGEALPGLRLRVVDLFTLPEPPAK